jgi:PAS domain S-box-containing protein
MATASQDSIITSAESSRLTLAAALGAAKGFGTFEWVVADDVVRVDGRIAELYGFEPTLSREAGLPVETYLGRIHADDRPAMEELVERTLHEAEDYQIEYRVRQEDGSNIWCRALGRTLASEGRGDKARIVGVIIDIDEEKRASLEAAKEAQLQAVLQGAGLGSWTWHLQTGEVRYNERWAAMLGYRLDEIQPSFAAFDRLLHPGDRSRVEAALDAHLRGGAPFYSEEIRLQHKQGHWVWVKTTGSVTHRGDDGEALIASGTHEDITLRREHEAVLSEAKVKVDLALGEVNHRVQNLFALVPALVSLSANETDDAFELAQMIRSRVEALARSHSLTLGAYNRAEGVDLRAMVEAVLEPYAASDWGERFAVKGPEVRLNEGEASAASLALHEFATNAAKHGALSVPDGRVSIGWSVAAEPGAVLSLSWQEQDGPLVKEPPVRRGSGTQLVDRLVATLKGQITRNWAPAGLSVEMAFPLRPAGRAS